MTREKLIEVMARAIGLSEGANYTVGNLGIPFDQWEFWKPQAEAAILALEAAGVRMVPVEAQADQINAARRATLRYIPAYPNEVYAVLYSALLAASPYAQKDTKE